MRKYAPHLAISAALAAIIAAGLLIFWPYSTTVVFVVRHAERTDTPAPVPTPIPTPTPCTASTSCTIASNAANPPLSVIGQARRDELAHVLEHTGIQAIFASCFCRTEQTVEALANDLNLTTTKLSQGSQADIDVLVEQLNTTHVGQKVLVAGHTSSVPDIIAALGGGTVDPIDELEFDNLYVVTINRGWWRWWGWGKRVRVIRLKYGARFSTAP